MSTFTLEFWTDDEDFCIYATGDNYEKEITLARQASAIVASFDAIYDILEEKITRRADELAKAVKILGEQLLAPFAAPIKQCDLVRIIVYDDLIYCPFDLLPVDGTALFLQRPVCYQIAEGKGDDTPTIELGSALLIADLTADPEEACLAVSRQIPNAQYAKMEDANLRMIAQAADQVDALVVSAHGSLEDDNSGSIALNDEEIRAALVAKLEAWVVYFDSCGQGANMSFVQAMQDDSEVQFYLAPIISNDAGDSSTKTMIWFFTATQKHLNPIRALFETRQRLFAYYQTEKKLDLVTTLNKAFPFRIYEFVEEA